MDTEWDLIVQSEDIKKGDKIVVENIDSGLTTIMKLLKIDKRFVYLKCDDNIFKFEKDSLEDVTETFLIIGKYE